MTLFSLSDEENCWFVDAFIDQQEWRLHEHVETSTKLLSSPFTPSQNQHPAFSATCKAII